MSDRQQTSSEQQHPSMDSCANGECVFKQMRGSLQQGIYKVINPFVRLLIKLGVTPNMVTAIGLLGTAGASALIFIAGKESAVTGIPDYTLLLWAGIVNIAFSLFDMLDGQVARLGGMESKFGAFYDSVLDRYSELLITGAITFYFFFTHNAAGVFITLLATMGSLMVSYVRARGEALGVAAKNGLMQRPERVVVTAVALIAAGWAGMKATCTCTADTILMAAMGLIAVLANLTALARINFCRKHLSGNDQK